MAIWQPGALPARTIWSSGVKSANKSSGIVLMARVAIVVTCGIGTVASAERPAVYQVLVCYHVGPENRDCGGSSWPDWLVNGGSFAKHATAPSPVPKEHQSSRKLVSRVLTGVRVNSNLEPVESVDELGIYAPAMDKVMFVAHLRMVQYDANPSGVPSKIVWSELTTPSGQRIASGPWDGRQLVWKRSTRHAIGQHVWVRMQHWREVADKEGGRELMFKWLRVEESLCWGRWPRAATDAGQLIAEATAGGKLPPVSRVRYLAAASTTPPRLLPVVFSSLGKHQDLKSIPHMLACLDHMTSEEMRPIDKAKVTSSICDAIAGMPTDKVVPILINSLEGQDKETHRRAITVGILQDLVATHMEIPTKGAWKDLWKKRLAGESEVESHTIEVEIPVPPVRTPQN